MDRTTANKQPQSEISTLEVPPNRVRLSALGMNAGNGVLLLPSDFYSAENSAEFLYTPEALDIKALLRGAQIDVNTITHDEEGHPKFVENRDANWVGPIVLFGAAYLSQNPDTVAVALGVLANHIYDVFRGSSAKKSCTLSVVVEDEDGRCVKFDYSGAPEGLDKLINSVTKLVNKN